MTRASPPGSWALTPRQVSAFRDLRRALRKDSKWMQDGILAEKLGMNPASFSQAANGKPGRVFSPDHKTILKTTLSELVEGLRRAAKDDVSRLGELQAVSDNFEIVFGEHEQPGKRDYCAPGGELPLSACNYIEREADALSERILDIPSKTHLVLGGPRSGKSSFLRRLESQVRRSGQSCHFVDVMAVLEEAHPLPRTGPLGRLSLIDLANVISTAITGDPKPVVRQDVLIGQAISDKLAEILSRPKFADSILIIDGFNYLCEHAVDWGDVNTIMAGFVTPRRGDNCKVIIADSGLHAVSDMVSEWISRAGQTLLCEMSEFDLRRLASVSLPAGVGLDEHDSKAMTAAFGGIAFLHHAAIDKVRAGLIGRGSEPIPTVEIKNLVEAAIESVLEKVVGAAPEGEGDRVDREIARFGIRASRQLHHIKAVHETQVASVGAGDQLLRKFADPTTPSPVMPNYIVRRMLTYAGFADSGEFAYGFISRISQKLLDRGVSA
ncbi:MAG: hypothetical protein V4574_00085 [Pseudomonadota bacterium]